MPRFQELSDSIVSFVGDGGVSENNDMVMGPHVRCNPRAFGRSFDVRYVFFFPHNKRSACFTHITSLTVSARNSVDNFRL